MSTSPAPAPIGNQPPATATAVVTASSSSAVAADNDPVASSIMVVTDTETGGLADAPVVPDKGEARSEPSPAAQRIAAIASRMDTRTDPLFGTRPASTNTWSADETRFNHVSEFSNVYIPEEADLAGTQTEALAAASGRAAQFIRNMHGSCFNQVRGGVPISDVARACAVISTELEAVTRMDAKAITDLFHDRISLMQAAIKDIERDSAITAEQRVEIFTAARATVSQMMTLNDLLITHNKLRLGVQASMANSLPSDAEASWRYMPDEGGDTENALQKLYRFALFEAQRLGFARYKDCFMRRVVTSEGLITNAWDKVATFREFVYELTSQPNGYIQFLCGRAVNIMDNVADLLIKRREPTVPWLKPDRTVFAFRNGCYLADSEMFVRYTRTGPPVMPNKLPCATACKYHDLPFNEDWLDETKDWYDIPTPLMDHIMDTQRLSPDVKRCYYSMLGRAIYDLGKHDNWQVFLFVRGQAETGKSTLLKFISTWYNAADVGILSNNIEEKFGASMLAGKYVIIGDDLGENFSLDQQLFQNMASANDVSMPVKNGNAIVIQWSSPLLLSGNVLPDYKDTAGSFSRRVFIVWYSVQLRKVDPTLPERLKMEIAASIVKCNRAYRNMCRRLEYLRSRPESEGGPLSFWEVVPEEFRVQKRNVQQCANSYMSFLNSGQLVYGPNLYMPKDLFVTQLMQYCQANGMPKPKFVASQYDGSFSIMGIGTTGKCKRPYPRTKDGKEMFESWIVGCDIVSGEALASATSSHIMAAEAAAASGAAMAASLDVDNPAAIATTSKDTLVMVTRKTATGSSSSTAAVSTAAPSPTSSSASSKSKPPKKRPASGPPAGSAPPPTSRPRM